MALLGIVVKGASVVAHAVGGALCSGPWRRGNPDGGTAPGAAYIRENEASLINGEFGATGSSEMNSATRLRPLRLAA